jgi:alpha-L-fucosidase
MTLVPDTASSERLRWFTEARFGMFIHFGLYSLAARHEQMRRIEAMPQSAYDRYFERFRIDRYDAEEWARIAVTAGMRYAVLTTKHHDGFCLWDTQTTDYCVSRTPAKRDVVGEWVSAFRAAGLKIGFYHSIIDWHHPDYPVDEYHPDWNPTLVDQLNAGRRPERYREYLRAQVTELVQRWSPDIMWFDFAYPGTGLVSKGKDASFFGSADLLDVVRTTSPATLVNDRLDLPGTADFTTPEDTQPATGLGGPWEVCWTLNGSWGYAPGYADWRSAGQVAELLVDAVSKGGNLLLNVGPDGRGAIEPRARGLLAEVGDWLELHAPSVIGAGPATTPAPSGCRTTQNEDRVFLHLTGSWPVHRLVLPDLPAPLRYASFMHDAAEVPFRVVQPGEGRVPHEVAPGPAGSTVLTLPNTRPDTLIPVVELEFDWSGAPG